MGFKNIDVTHCKELMAATPGVVVIDVRDPKSYAAGHIEGAQNAAQMDLHAFAENTAKDTPIVFCCFHGISSQKAAMQFCDLGFSNIYSLQGGYTAWAS